MKIRFLAITFFAAISLFAVVPSAHACTYPKCTGNSDCTATLSDSCILTNSTSVVLCSGTCASALTTTGIQTSGCTYPKCSSNSDCSSYGQTCYIPPNSSVTISCPGSCSSPSSSAAPATTNLLSNGSACQSASQCSGGFCNPDTSNPDSMYGVCASSAATKTTEGVAGSRTKTTEGAAGTSKNITLINPLGAGTDIQKLINQILAFVIRIGAIVVILMLVYVGFLFVTARGEPAKITAARQALLWTIVGALILLGAQVISLGIQATVQALSTGG